MIRILDQRLQDVAGIQVRDRRIKLTVAAEHIAADGVLDEGILCVMLVESARLVFERSRLTEFSVFPTTIDVHAGDHLLAIAEIQEIAGGVARITMRLTLGERLVANATCFRKR